MLLLFSLFTVYFISFAVCQLGPASFVSSKCIVEKCAGTLGNISELNDPRNINKILKDIERICSNYVAAKKCSLLCPEADQEIFMHATQFLQYGCVERKENLKLLGPCVAQKHEPVQAKCQQQCGDLEKLMFSGDEPASTPSLYSGLSQLGPLCKALKCTIKCLTAGIDKKCPGAGEFFKDLVIRQVTEANKERTSFNKTLESIARLIKQALPKECSYMTDAKELGDYIELEENDDPSTEEQNDDSNVEIDHIKIPEKLVAPEAEPNAAVTTIISGKANLIVAIFLALFRMKQLL